MIKQLPELPTGCEVTSLAMALNFYDLNIKHTSLADSFLEKAHTVRAITEKYLWATPEFTGHTAAMRKLS